jgi:hypothetical protein
MALRYAQFRSQERKMVIGHVYTPNRPELIPIESFQRLQLQYASTRDEEQWVVRSVVAQGTPHDVDKKPRAIGMERARLPSAIA